MSKIDINQRIPLHILEIGLRTFLEGTYDPAYIEEQLVYEYAGKNRVKKAMSFVNKTILRTPLMPLMLENKEEILNALKQKGDRSVILISLLNSVFPFSFTALNSFAKYFKVQEFVSTGLIKKDAISLYGSNRSTENALYCVIPMFLEAGLFIRTKPGLYQFNEKVILRSRIAYDLYMHSFLLYNPLLKDSEIVSYEPYFSLVELVR